MLLWISLIRTHSAAAATASTVRLLEPLIGALDSQAPLLTPECVANCSGRGQCLEGNKCSCFSGFTGESCADEVSPRAL
jgi:hypothetical protein